MRKKVFLILTILTLSIISALMSLWLNEDSFSMGSRLFIYYSHKDYVNGTGPAPNQYRIMPYFLIEKLFKYIPINWRNDFHRFLISWVGKDNDKRRLQEAKRNYDAFFPEQKRLEIADMIKNYLKQAVAGSLQNRLIETIVNGFIDNISFDPWVKDPAEFFRTIVDQLPADFRALFDDKSDVSKVINGYVSFRFTFTLISLILLFIWLRNFLNDFETIFCIFLFGVFYLHSMRYFSQPEAPLSLSLFLSILLLTYHRKNWLLIAFLLVLGSFARSDHMLFAALIYALYNFEFNKRGFFSKQTVKSLILLSIPLLITYVLVKIMFSHATYYSRLWQIWENLTDPWAWILFGAFIAMPFLFIDGLRKVEFFRKTYLWMIPFFIMNFLVGRIIEIRIFLPMLVYLLPIIGFGTRSLLVEDSKERSN